MGQPPENPHDVRRTICTRRSAHLERVHQRAPAYQGARQGHNRALEEDLYLRCWPVPNCCWSERLVALECSLGALGTLIRTSAPRTTSGEMGTRRCSGTMMSTFIAR